MYLFWGKVKKGKQRGKALGFPTANVALGKKIIPQGIYISKTKIRNRLFPSLTFIGAAKTFNEKDFQSETYIFSFDKLIYNKWISVKLMKKIRNNRKFKSKEELIEQMEDDKKVAIGYFKFQN